MLNVDYRSARHLTIVSQTGDAANDESDARTRRTPKVRLPPDNGMCSRPILREALWECDASSQSFALQERTLVSLVQFIFNTAT